MAYYSDGSLVSEIASFAHGQMQDTGNTDAFVVNGADEDHVYHTNGMASSTLEGWTFDAGGAGTSFPIASVADGADAGVDIEVTTTGSHTLAAGAIVSHTNMTVAAYEGIFVVKAIISATQYEVAAVFSATATGTMDEAATLTAGAAAVGDCTVHWAASATSAVNNEIFDYSLFKNATVITGSITRRKFGTAGDVGSMGGVALVTIADGDKISFVLRNTSSAGNLTLRNFTLMAHELT